MGFGPQPGLGVARVIFLDSWVWLEAFFQGSHAADALELVCDIGDEGAVIAPTVLLEINYRARREEGVERAQRLMRTIRRIEHLLVEPLTTDIALHAAELRDDYYQRRSLELSYADAIHIATAVATGCDRLYSGDPDFAPISEVQTVVIR
jgi:predicted nucleic acid-binding protein